MHALHDPCIYEGIEKMGLPDDLQGWPRPMHSIVFSELIEELRPQTIIEVGSWKGVSACMMADLSSHLGTDIICCDTWLGSLEHMLEPDEERNYAFRRLHGLPLLYFQFLANVKRAGFADRITPIPNTSLTCANYLLNMKVKADMIYVDGDHTRFGCYNDLMGFQCLLREPKKSVLFGDDWNIFKDVNKAVNSFVEDHPNRWTLQVKEPLWTG